MSSWRHDPEAAADALIVRSLDDLTVAGRVLLVNQSRSLPSAVRRRGAEVTVWNRRLVAGSGHETWPAASWPPAGPFDIAFVRLPKARDEQAMTMHAAISVLAPGGRLIVYGGNDEGIRSAVPVLEGIVAPSEVTTLAARGHGRVLLARRSDEGEAALRGNLAAWRQVSGIEIVGTSRDWVSYPGCFAAGRVDEGTGLLLPVLPVLLPGVRVLDYGCGPGAIAAALIARQPAIEIDAMDNDAVALEAVRENVPTAGRTLGAGVADARGRGYDLIVSNPPLHQGIAEDRGLLERLIADAPAHLAPDGCLQLVVQRRIPLERLLRGHFANIETLAETGRYWVWRARLSGA